MASSRCGIAAAILSISRRSGGVEDRIERRVQIVLQEQPDHRMRGNEIDLEAASRRDRALPLERREVAVRRDGVIGIEQVAEMHVLRRLARPEAIARAPRRGGMQAEHLVGFFERGVIGKDRLQMCDPVAAFAGLAVGNALEPRPERRPHRFEHRAGIGKRYAADQMNVAGHMAFLRGLVCVLKNQAPGTTFDPHPKATKLLRSSEMMRRAQADITPYTSAAMSGSISTLNFDPPHTLGGAAMLWPRSPAHRADEETRTRRNEFITLVGLRPGLPYWQWRICNVAAAR